MTDTNLAKASLLLSAITTIVVLIATSFLRANIKSAQNDVKEAIKSAAIMEYGTEENYNLMKQVYSHPNIVQQQKDSLQSTLSSLGAAVQTDSTGTTNTPPAIQGVQADASGTMTEEQLASVRENAYVYGDENAKVTIIEYADPECPYCVLHHQAGTLHNLVDGSNGAVNLISKVVEGVNHTNTEYKSLAALCAGQLGGKDAYYGMIDKMATNSVVDLQNRIDNPVAITEIPTYAKELNIDADKLQACIDSKELVSIYNANWSEFMGLTSRPGTPGNLVLNNETGEWYLLMGAHPQATFQNIIDSMTAEG